MNATLITFDRSENVGNLYELVDSLRSRWRAYELGEATVKLTDEDGDSVVISDVRVAVSNDGELFVSMPRFYSHEGLPGNCLAQPSKRLMQKIADAVLEGQKQDLI
jgi:DNA-binding cell septation regulator SpoVG